MAISSMCGVMAEFFVSRYFCILTLMFYYVSILLVRKIMSRKIIEMFDFTNMSIAELEEFSREASSMIEVKEFALDSFDAFVHKYYRAFHDVRNSDGLGPDSSWFDRAKLLLEVLNSAYPDEQGDFTMNFARLMFLLNKDVGVVPLALRKKIDPSINY